MLEVREGGRVVNVHALLATGVNADGHREILGLEVTSGEDGAGWLTFFRGLDVLQRSRLTLIINPVDEEVSEPLTAAPISA